MTSKEIVGTLNSGIKDSRFVKGLEEGFDFHVFETESYSIYVYQDWTNVIKKAKGYGKDDAACFENLWLEEVSFDEKIPYYLTFRTKGMSLRLTVKEEG